MAECSDRQYMCCLRQPTAWFVVWISRGRIKALPIHYTCEYTFISIIIIVIMSSICVDKCVASMVSICSAWTPIECCLIGLLYIPCVHVFLYFCFGACYSWLFSSIIILHKFSLPWRYIKQSDLVCPWDSWTAVLPTTFCNIDHKWTLWYTDTSNG